MMKRVACAILSFMLLVALWGVSLAEDTATATAQPSGDAAGQQRVVIALSTADTKGQEVAFAAAQWLLQPLLAGKLGTGVTVDLYLIDDTTTSLGANLTLETQADLDELYSLLHTKKITIKSNADTYAHLVDTLLADLVAADDTAQARSTELWVVDQRDYLFTPLPDGEAKDSEIALENSFASLLAQCPDLTLRFASLTKDASASTDGSMADQVDRGQADASRVVLDRIDISSMTQAYTDAMGIAQAQLRAVVNRTESLTLSGEGQTWTCVFQHQPVGETGDALLLFPWSDAEGIVTIDSVHFLPSPTAQNPTAADGGQTATPTGAPAAASATDMPSASAAADAGSVAQPDEQATDTADTSATPNPADATSETAASTEGETDVETPAFVNCVIPSDAGQGWILLHQAPAGQYELQLTIAKKEPPMPTVAAYQLVPERTVFLKANPDSEQQTLDETVIWYRDPAGSNQSHALRIITDALDIPALGWQIELLRNGVSLPLSTPPEVYDQTQNGMYGWLIRYSADALGDFSVQARLTMADSGFSLLSNTVHITVINRLPQPSSEALTAYGTLFDFPDDRAMSLLTVDLNTLFDDPDADSLTFAIAANSTDAQEAYQATIIGGELQYTPLNGTQDTMLTILAWDEPSIANAAGAAQPGAAAADTNTADAVSAADTDAPTGTAGPNATGASIAGASVTETPAADAPLTTAAANALTADESADATPTAALPAATDIATADSASPAPVDASSPSVAGETIPTNAGGLPTASPSVADNSNEASVEALASVPPAAPTVETGNEETAARQVLTIHQYSVKALLASLQATFDAGLSANIAMVEPGIYSGSPGKEMTLVYRLTADATLTAAFDSADDVNGFPATLLALVEKLNPRFLTDAANGNAAQTLQPNITTDGNDVLMSFTLPAQAKNTKEQLQAAAEYDAYALPSLMESPTVQIQNTPPILRDGVKPEQTFSNDLNDYPGNTPVLPLTDLLGGQSINLCDYITDLETPDQLTFTIRIAGTARYQWFDQAPVDASATPEGIDYTLTVQDGQCPVQLNVLSTGSLQVLVSANDGEFTLNNALNWHMNVRSAFIRLLILIGLCVLALALLVVAFLLWRQSRKPSFRNVSVAVYALEDRFHDPYPAPDASQAVSLAPYGKGSVSLLSLLMLFRQPPLPKLNAKITDGITLTPLHKGFATLTLSDDAMRGGFTVSPQPRGNAKAIPLTSERVEITATAADAPESILLYFFRTSPKGDFTSVSASEPLWVADTPTAASDWETPSEPQTPSQKQRKAEGNHRGRAGRSRQETPSAPANGSGDGMQPPARKGLSKRSQASQAYPPREGNAYEGSAYGDQSAVYNGQPIGNAPSPRSNPYSDDPFSGAEAQQTQPTRGYTSSDAQPGYPTQAADSVYDGYPQTGNAYANNAYAQTSNPPVPQAETNWQRTSSYGNDYGVQSPTTPQGYTRGQPYAGGFADDSTASRQPLTPQYNRAGSDASGYAQPDDSQGRAGAQTNAYHGAETNPGMPQRYSQGAPQPKQAAGSPSQPAYGAQRTANNGVVQGWTSPPARQGYGAPDPNAAVYQAQNELWNQYQQDAELMGYDPNHPVNGSAYPHAHRTPRDEAPDQAKRKRWGR